MLLDYLCLKDERHRLVLAVISHYMNFFICDKNKNSCYKEEKLFINAELNLQEVKFVNELRGLTAANLLELVNRFPNLPRLEVHGEVHPAMHSDSWAWK
jgi:hypothetical protein